MNIRMPTRVVKLEERKRVTGGKKDSDGQAILTSETVGWFVHFEGSYESLYVGKEKPVGLDPGTKVDIIIAPRTT